MNLISRDTFDNESDSRLYNRIAWRLLPFLFVLYIVAFLDKVNVGFAKLQMSADIGLSDMAYGFGAGVFFLGYCLFEVPSNMMLARVGARFWISRIMVTWGILSVSMMFVTTPESFYVLRFLLGVAEAGFFPGVMLYMTYWFPARTRSQTMALFSLGVAVGGVVGSPLSGWIMETFAGVAGMAGWQWLFLLEGSPAVLLGIVVFFYLDDRPGHVKWLTREQNERVVRHMAEQNLADQHAGAKHDFRAAFVNKDLWRLIFVNFTLLCTTYGVSFWLPQIVRDLNIGNLTVTGFVSAIPFAIASVMMIVIGKHSDKTGERRWHGTLSIVASAIGLALTAYFHSNPMLAMVGLSIAMSGALCGFCVLWALPASLLGGAAAAAGIALITSIGNLGSYASPFMMGWVKQATGHLEFGLYVLAVVALLGALTMLIIRTVNPHAPTGVCAAQA